LLQVFFKKNVNESKFYFNKARFEL